MKCKHCNGTGKVRGYFYEKTGVNKWEKVWGDSPCDECNGTGEIKVTNEEWFCTLPTEEKAKVIVNIHNLAKLEQIEWWLKQPHTSKE